MDPFWSDVGEEDGGSDTFYEAPDQPKGQGSSEAVLGLGSISEGFGDIRLDMPGSFPG